MKKGKKSKRESPKKVLILFCVAIALIVVFLFTTRTITGITGKTIFETPEERLAKCLIEKGAILYGESADQNKQAQEAVFGKFFKDFKYVDCSKERGRCMTKVRMMPAWEVNNKIYFGISAKRLAQTSSCPLE